MKRLLALAALLFSTVAHAESVHTYVLAIGNDAVPVGASAGLTPLRYADDDAARVFQLGQSFAQSNTLLSVLDAESQARFPDAARAALPPTLWELRAVLHDLRNQLLADRQAGRTSSLLFFFSGHGSNGPEGAALALLDGGITRQVLYGEILTLPVTHIHLIVDACHAEAVVRPRDASAAAVDVSADEAQRWVERETLARFPNVGAVLATSPEQQTHEWDRYQAGVFSHEVLSGLRGAADVNGDHQIEYSELHAFIAAANREVRDPRARPEVLVHAPPIDLRAPLVRLDAMRGVAWASFGATDAPVWLETANGERLVDGFVEAGHRMRVAVPGFMPLFYRTQAGEALVQIATGKEIKLDTLRVSASSVRARGALASSLDDGVFAVPFGPAYYRGFVDRQDLASVAFPMDDHQPRRRSIVPSATLCAGAGALGLASIVTGGLALAAKNDYDGTNLQRVADDARHRYDTYRIAAFATLGVSLAAVTVGLAVHPWKSRHKH